MTIDRTDGARPVELPDSPTLPALVRDLARATPDAPALVAGEVRWSYADLDLAARRAAGALAGIGVGAGDSVGLLATNVAAWPATALGAMRVGARVDAFNTWVKAWDLEFLLRTSQCRVLVVTARVRSSDMLGELRELVGELWEAEPGAWRSERFPSLEHVVVLGPGASGATGEDGAGASGATGEDGAGASEPLPPGALRWDELVAAAEPVAPDTVAARADDAAYVLYTSGSTRDPKAVPLLQRDTIVNAFEIGERMGLTAADRVWLTSPLFWSYGGVNAWPATLSHGACLVLQEHFEAAAAAELMAREQVTAAYLLPTLTDALAEVGERVRAVASLRTGLTIGRPDEVRRAVDELDVPEICNIYGSTETYGNCCVTDHATPLELRLTTQGPPLGGVEVRTVDEDGRVQAGGELGELQVRGRITPGYLNADNAEVITADGWFRTGDQLRIRADGAVEFGARLTDMIKTSGINVAPMEVESYLSSHPQVAEVVVVGAPHPARGEVVIAFVVTEGEGGDEVDGAALRQFCRDGIAGYKVPWEVVVVSELPRTGTGKLTRRTLLELAAERTREVTT